MPSATNKPKRNCVSAKFLADQGANFTFAGFRLHCSKLDQYTNPKGGGLDKLPLNTTLHEQAYRAYHSAPTLTVEGAPYRSEPPQKPKSPFMKVKTRYQLACHLLGIGQVTYWTGSKGRETLLGLDIDDHQSSDAETIHQNSLEALALFTEMTGWTPQTCRSGRGLHGFLLLDKGWLTAHETNQHWHGIVRLVQAEAKRRGLAAKLECKGKARIVNDTTSYAGLLLKDPFTAANPTDLEIQAFWGTLEEQRLSDSQLKDNHTTLANLAYEAELPVMVPLGQQPPLTSSTKTDSPTEPGADLPGVAFTGEWAKNCRHWAIHGLQEHDSMADVVYELSKWLYFIELEHIPEDNRLTHTIEVLQRFCLTKHNGYITRLNNNNPDEVLSHVERIVKWMIQHITTPAKECFARIRQKRQQGQYTHQWMLEQDILSIYLSSSVKLIECCSVSPSKEERKKQREKPPDPEQWVYTPDLTPLPEQMERLIQEGLKRNGARGKTYPKLVGFLNHIRAKDGEARLGIESLKKMGFSDHRARQHINMLRQMGLLLEKGYSPVIGLGKLYVLTAKARELFGMPVFDPEEK